MAKFPQLFDVKSDTDDDFDVVCTDGWFVVLVNDSDGNRVATLKGKHLSLYHLYDNVDVYGNACGLDVDSSHTSTTNIDIGFQLPNYLAV